MGNTELAYHHKIIMQDKPTDTPDALTAELDVLNARIDNLIRTVADRDEEIRNLRAEINERESSIKIRDLEIRELSAVIMRNLKRVEAETMVAAQQIALASAPSHSGRPSQSS